MPNIQEYMTEDHRRCDELFALGEESVSQGNWDRAKQQTSEFISAMEHHFMMEEQVLFPAFEQRSGITEGPTSVMRREHQQMRELFGELEPALEEKRQEDYLDTMETLLILMQQHNMKEEGMLYPMSDKEIGVDVEQLIADMEQVSGQ
ncbi:MAG: hemerythrin domain-containing protein [Proteobacteria bacterium]|nr:hemerythrin domain-containing protein [Pseudomonadota bacterium]